MTTDTLSKLEHLLTYSSRSLARDDAMSLIRSLPTLSERMDAERWYAQNLGWSGSQELRSKYNI